MFRIVDVFEKSAFVDLPTAIADIGNLEAIGTYLFNKVRTVLRTIRAQLAVLRGWTMTFLPAAYFLCPTGLTMLAGIKTIPRPSGCYLR